MKISGLAPIQAPALTQASPADSGTGFASGFASALGTAIGEVQSAQANAKNAAMDLLAGGAGDIHDVALASQRAELAMELFQQVRNKFVQAYQEIMKMPM